MRATIALACTVVAAQLLSATEPAQAQKQGLWCLRTDSGGSDCTYSSLAQCRALTAKIVSRSRHLPGPLKS